MVLPVAATSDARTEVDTTSTLESGLEHSESSLPTSHKHQPISWKHRIRHFVKHSDFFRTALSTVYVITVGLLMGFLQQISDTRWHDNRPGEEDLYDAGFAAFNHISQDWLPDLFVLSLLGATVIGVLFFCPNWETRQIVLRRLNWLTGTLYLYRAVTISVTTLPAPRPCSPATIHDSTFWKVVWTTIRMVVGDAKACTDNIFSGHTMILTSCALHWRIYVRRKYIGWYVYLHVIVGMYTIICTRLHYTVDVVLAVFITYGMYTIYFCVLRMAMERHRWASEQSQASTNGKLWEKYDEKYQEIAFTPRMLNSGLTAAIIWADALDLRWEKEAFDDSDAQMI